MNLSAPLFAFMVLIWTKGCNCHVGPSSTFSCLTRHENLSKDKNYIYYGNNWFDFRTRKIKATLRILQKFKVASQCTPRQTYLRVSPTLFSGAYSSANMPRVALEISHTINVRTSGNFREAELSNKLIQQNQNLFKTHKSKDLFHTINSLHSYIMSWIF